MTWSERARAKLSGWSRDFYEADTRWLALFRIAFGALLFGYALWVPMGQRLDAYFTDAGLLPMDVFQSVQPVDHRYTLFRFAHDRSDALLVFRITALIDLLFALGAFTRLTGPLAVLLTISIHHRAAYVVNGSMITMHLLGLWSVLLPLGRHASVDAWIARRRGIILAPLRVRSFAVLALRLQLFAIYYFNVVHKTGETWRRGTAVHYVLWQQRAAWPTAIFVREHEPRWFSVVASHGTLVVELALAILVLLPVYRVPARRLAAVLIVVLHGAFATMLDLGPFPFVFACAALLLLASEDGRVLPGWLDGGAVAEDERVAARWPWARRAREAVLIAFGVHAFFCTWDGNPAMQLVFGRPHMPQAFVAIRDALSVPQAWRLFAPDAPAGDMVLLPVVVLADGRQLDVRRRAPPDFEVADGRYLSPDAFDQTLDARLVFQPDWVRTNAFADYIARVPSLEGWPERDDVRQVRVYVYSGPRPAPGERPRPLPDVSGLVIRDYPDGAPRSR